LTTDKNKFEWSDENHLKTILSTIFFDEKQRSPGNDETPIEKRIGSKLAGLISQELKVAKADIIDVDIIMYDTHPSRVIGFNKEFVASGRLDNLGSTLTAVHSIIGSISQIEKQTSMNFIACFDDEEVGSLTFQGANGAFFPKTMKRVYESCREYWSEYSEQEFDVVCAKSFLLSCDMAHAFNPNYAEKYHSDHRTYMQEGITLKVNHQMRYSSEAEGQSLVKEICGRAGVPNQTFMVRQDGPCGTTIGPIITAKIGIKSVDVGICQFAMHSIRETCGIMDLLYYKKFYEEFFNSYEQLIGNLNIK